MQKKDKLRLYRVLKVEWGREEYLGLPTEQRVLLAELRCGTNRLRVETGRWKQEVWEDRICLLCGSGEVEDERHVLLKCALYTNLREQFFRRVLDDTGFDFSLRRTKRTGF